MRLSHCDERFGICSLNAGHCMLQVLFQNGKFQWQRAEKLLGLAKEGSGGLDITSTVRDAVKVVLLDDKLRMQLVNAFTEDNKLHIDVSLIAWSLWVRDWDGRQHQLYRSCGWSGFWRIR